MKIGVVMDPINSIKPYKDSTFAMLLEAQRRSWDIYYMELRDIFYAEQQVFANTQKLKVADKKSDWFEQTNPQQTLLSELDVILMRKDPPFTTEYVYTTALLELAQRSGVLVINDPKALRDFTEKLAITKFPQCCAPTVVARDHRVLKEFFSQYRDVIFKPLDGMGGQSVFRVQKNDPNLNVILETLTQNEQRYIMAQQFIPEISAGDKRILLINGAPIPYALARIPVAGETRGNLAAGGNGVGVELSERDRWICDQVGPSLRDNGLVFVGLDVIGDYLTEINVTSPTCIRQLDAQYQINISEKLFNCIEQLLAKA